MISVMTGGVGSREGRSKLKVILQEMLIVTGPHRSKTLKAIFVTCNYD